MFCTAGHPEHFRLVKPILDFTGFDFVKFILRTLDENPVLERIFMNIYLKKKPGFWKVDFPKDFPWPYLNCTFSCWSRMTGVTYRIGT